MLQSSANRASRAGFVSVAPWVFVLLWSTGFIGARFGLPFIEPFTFLGLRFVIAALLLGLLAQLMGTPQLRSRAEATHSIVVGLLMHGCYLGGVFFAIDRGMPAGLTALMVSLQPILTAIFSRITVREQVTGRQWVGLLLGLLGVGLVVGEKLAQTASGLVITPATTAAILIALAGTTLGTLYQKRFGATVPLLSGTSTQYVAAAALMLMLSLAVETRRISWTPELIFALAWLVVMLSLGAVLLLMVLIQRRSAAQVTSLFYLVPPATAVEAFLFFGERFGLVALAGLALASIGVALVVMERR